MHWITKLIVIIHKCANIASYEGWYSAGICHIVTSRHACHREIARRLLTSICWKTIRTASNRNVYLIHLISTINKLNSLRRVRVLEGKTFKRQNFDVISIAADYFIKTRNVSLKSLEFVDLINYPFSRSPPGGFCRINNAPRRCLLSPFRGGLAFARYVIAPLLALSPDKWICRIMFGRSETALTGVRVIDILPMSKSAVFPRKWNFDEKLKHRCNRLTNARVGSRPDLWESCGSRVCARARAFGRVQPAACFSPGWKSGCLRVRARPGRGPRKQARRKTPLSLSLT